jgi:hypothetical protein
MAAACRVIVVVVILLGAAVSGGMARAQNSPVADVACGLHERITQKASGGMWVISRPNAFDTSGQQLCISGPINHPGFTDLNNLRYTGAWQAYPFTGVGCAYRLCSPVTNLPMKVRTLPANSNTSFSWTGSAPGNWNVSYDIWFDQHNQITAQDDGAELMIWLRPNPGYRGGVRVHISKQWYWFLHWRTCNSVRQTGITPPRVSATDHAGICWNYVQFRFLKPVHGVQRLWIMPFIRFLEGQGLVRSSWWLTSIHAGYELVSGGKGLTTTWFNADVGGHTGSQPWSTRQASPAAAQANGAVDVLYKATDTTLGHEWFNPRLGWRGPASMGSQVVSGEPSVITSVPGTTDAFWQGADGNLWHQYTTGSGWSSQQAMNLGPLGGPPKAVAQPDGTEYVFWRGTDNHLWYATFIPGGNWSSAHDLGGDLASDPAPAVSSPGTVDVFWKGTDGNLWHAYQTPGHSWHAPVNLNVGALSSAPAATAQPNGAEDVFWRGTDGTLEHTYYTPQGNWHAPNDLGGNVPTTAAPLTAVTSAPGTVDVFWQGTDGNLWHAYTTVGHTWHTAASLGMGPLGSTPFATAQPNGAENVFWRGSTDDHLWQAYYHSGGHSSGWHGPQNLGGHLYPMP